MNEVKHAVVRTDLMHGTDVRADLVSVRYQPSKTMTAVDNGNVVVATALEEGSRTVFAGDTPKTTTPLNDVVLIASPEVMYDERMRNLEDYTNEAGKIARGYKLVPGSEFSVTEEALTNGDALEVGKVVELQADTKLKVVASKGSSTVVGHIIAIENAGRHKFYVIHVD